MPKFSVKTPVRLDGDDYAPGESIELTAKQAAAMGEDVVTPIIETKTSGANGNGGSPVKNLTLVLTVSVSDENAQSATTALMCGLRAANWIASDPPIDAPKIPMRSGSRSNRDRR